MFSNFVIWISAWPPPNWAGQRSIPEIASRRPASQVVRGAIMISGTYFYLAIVIFSIGTVAAYLLPMP